MNTCKQVCIKYNIKITSFRGKGMKRNAVYAIAWLSTGIAVSVAIYITKSATPLLAMLIPTFIMDSKKDE